MSLGHLDQPRILEVLERRSWIQVSEEAIAELNLQYEAVTDVDLLPLVQTARVLGEDHAAWAEEFDDIFRLEMAAYLLVGYMGKATLQKPARDSTGPMRASNEAMRTVARADLREIERAGS